MFKKILIAASILVSTLASANDLAKTNGDFFLEKPIGGVTFIGCSLMSTEHNGNVEKIVALDKVIYYKRKFKELIFKFHMGNSNVNGVVMEIESSQFDKINLEIIKRQTICKNIKVN